jgi:hypothetical protein
MVKFPLLILFVASPALAGSPATDSTVDWLMNQATTTPSTRPAATSQPSDVFEKPAANDESRAGVIEMSDGKSIRGAIATTAEKPVRVWVEADKAYQDIPFAMIRSIEARVLWERDEKEWHFKASGSDVKEYSGKTYPARETQYKFTLTDGTAIEGGVVAPLYVTVDGQTKTYVLHKRDKGEAGQTLAQLAFVKSVRFSD